MKSNFALRCITAVVAICTAAIGLGGCNSNDENKVSVTDNLLASVQKSGDSPNYDFNDTVKKPEGYEVIDLRLGGLASRLETCGKRLSDYLSGKLARIEELENELLCCDGCGKDFYGQVGFFASYERAASQSNLL